MIFRLADVPVCLGCAPEQVLTSGKPSTAFFSDGKQGATAWDLAPWASFVVTGAETDSRSVRQGDIFFCLKGDRADGHDFVSQAVSNGALAIVAERDPYSGEFQEAEGTQPHPPVFIVPDVQAALAFLASEYRGRIKAKVIGVTGSAGKTSVKEVLAQVLAVHAETSKNHMNLNSQIGLPASMLRASPDAAFWVMEAGISQPHDMDELGAILQPDAALVLNAGSAHVQGLGDKGTAFYKSRLLLYVQPGGAAFVSLDYPALTEHVDALAPVLKEKNVSLRTFSMRSVSADCYAAYTGSASDPAKGRYLVIYQGREYSVTAPFKGRYGAENVAAIYGIAAFLGLTHKEIETGFACAGLPGQRFSCVQRNDFIIIDDSYNANPLSMRRMLETAALMAQEAKKPLTLVMGEMLELGGEAASAHCQLGKEMAATGSSLIFWKGGQQEHVRSGLVEAGYQGSFFPVGGGQEFSALLEEIPLQAGLILFKGSRSIQLERLRDIVFDLVEKIGDPNAV